MKFSTGLLILVLSAHIAAQAQSVIRGIVADEATGKALFGANILIERNGQGTSTSVNGSFSIELNPGTYTIIISNVGFVPFQKDITVAGNAILDIGWVFLQPDAIALEEINIISSVARHRYTPVAMTAITSQVIENQSGDQPFPKIMNRTPGVYATRTGGGSGDAEINIRGLDQENIALMINGIPVSSVENGLLYWNNWLGLSDITRSVQIQRGLGISNVALNSVGGTINIITKTTEAKKGGAFGYALSSYGNQKTSLSLNSGLLENGWAITFFGARTEGPGYVDATYVDAWSYFLSVSRHINVNHKLVFTALGTPERHGQRNLKLTREEIDRFGLKFNKDWGSYNGEINNASENFYHKPYITLNHYWNISDKVFLASSAYYSPGYGGGKWSDTYSFADPPVFAYRNPSGQIDWDAIYLNNATHADTTILPDGEKVSGFSKNVQTHFLASHHWGGILSRLEYQVNDFLKLSGGIHARYFKSRLQQKITDLLGGDFYIDDYSWSLAGAAGRPSVKTTGDVIRVNNGAVNPSASIFAQAEYEKNNTTAFLSASVTGMIYQRYDPYNYPGNEISEVIKKSGYDIKGGFNQRFDNLHNIFINGGYFSRVPYFKFVFGSFNNVPTKGVFNEIITAFEIGYGLKINNSSLRANYYYTHRKDKNFLSNEYIQLDNNTSTRGLVTGLDALHTGFELDFDYRFNEQFSLAGLLSIGNWKWKNDVSATLFNDSNTPVDTVYVYADGLYVGGAPQFQAGLFGTLKVLKTFSITANWIYNDKLFASFDPALRTDPDDRSQPFKIPSYSLVDIHIYFPFRLENFPASLSLNCFNLFDSQHILRGEDGAGHNLETFAGFWDFGRNFNVALKVNF
jgi:iron complex outermembrane recepter protein